MKNYILSIPPKEKALLSSAIGETLVSMSMFSGETSAYVLQVVLSDGRLLTIRGMGKDVPNDGDVILDLHSFSVEEGEKDSDCSFEETFGKRFERFMLPSPAILRFLGGSVLLSRT
jgi:hypothetical protein